MQQTTPLTTPITEPVPGHYSHFNLPNESTGSAVSWGAVIGGALIAATLTITLIIGGSGLGFLAVSPWHNDGVEGDTLAIGTIVWLFVTQVIAYGIAGYVTGRLRTKWVDVKGDEVYFRDTAHGFLVWALSSIVGVVLISSAAASIISGTAKVGASVAGASAAAAGAAAGPALNDSNTFSLDYFTDSLLRPQNPDQTYDQTDNRKEVSTILTRGLAQGELSDEDKTYLVSIIEQQTGMSENEARARLEQINDRAKKAIDELETQTKEAADKARKAAAIFALWAFASLLLGAFVASIAATMGGRARDNI